MKKKNPTAPRLSALFLSLLTPVLPTFAAQAVPDQAIAREVTRNSLGLISHEALNANANLANMYNELLVTQALARDAARRGIAERIDVQQALMDSRRSILVQALRDEVMNTASLPTEDAVKEHYQKNKADFIIKEAIKGDIYLLDGSDTNSVAVAGLCVRKQSIDPETLQTTRYNEIATAEQAWVPREFFTDTVWEDIRHLDAGRVRYYKVEDNILLIRYAEHRAERGATLEEARALIEEQLWNAERVAVWEKYVNSLIQATPSAP